jgi:hypothetical protein
MNGHIRTFDENSTKHTFIKQTVIGFWRMLFEILLNVYLISSLLLLTSLVFGVVIVAWPLTFLAVTFTSMTEHMYDERRFQQQVEAEKAALEADKPDPPMDTPVTKTKAKV